MVTTEVLESSILIAFAVDAVLFALMYAVIWTRKLGGKHLPLRAVISEEDRHPSLARLQLLIWTFVAIFAFLTVSLTRTFSGVFLSITIPTNILTLIGISAGSPVVSAGVSRHKYDLMGKKYRTEAGDEGYAPLGDILVENGEFSVTRFQMLAWTFVAVVIFLAILMETLAHLPANLSTLNLPDVSSTLVILTGISQGAYLTGKGASRPSK